MIETFRQAKTGPGAGSGFAFNGIECLNTPLGQLFQFVGVLFSLAEPAIRQKGDGQLLVLALQRGFA